MASVKPNPPANNALPARNTGIVNRMFIAKPTPTAPKSCNDETPLARAGEAPAPVALEHTRSCRAAPVHDRPFR